MKLTLTAYTFKWTAHFNLMAQNDLIISPSAHLNRKLPFFLNNSDIKAIYIINYTTKAFTIFFLHFRISLGAVFFLKNMCSFILLKFNACDILLTAASPQCTQEGKKPRKENYHIKFLCQKRKTFEHEKFPLCKSIGRWIKFIIIWLCYDFLFIFPFWMNKNFLLLQICENLISKKNSPLESKISLSCFPLHFKIVLLLL